jgi:hypothetical protein
MRLRKHACALIPILVVACAGLPVPAVQAQAPDYSKVEFRSEKLADNLFVRFGAGEKQPLPGSSTSTGARDCFRPTPSSTGSSSS